MKYPFERLRTRKPVLTLGGISYRHKPLVWVRLFFGEVAQSVQALLDTGSDDTVFPGPLAARLGISLDGLPTASAAGVGGQPVPFALEKVRLSIHDGVSGCEWEAMVGFRLDQVNALPLLGQAGCLQFFTSEFRGDTHEVILAPNSTFPGTRT